MEINSLLEKAVRLYESGCFVEAISLIENSKIINNGKAFFILYQCFDELSKDKDNSPETDYKKRKYLEASATNGYSAAKVIVEFEKLFIGEYTNSDAEKAFRYIEKCTLIEPEIDSIYLAKCHLFGFGTKKDLPKAKEYLQQSTSNIVEKEFLKALIDCENNKITNDTINSMEFAAENDYPDACYAMGVINENIDKAEAKMWFTKARKLGYMVPPEKVDGYINVDFEKETITYEEYLKRGIATTYQDMRDNKTSSVYEKRPNNLTSFSNLEEKAVKYHDRRATEKKTIQDALLSAKRGNMSKRSSSFDIGYILFLFLSFMQIHSFFFVAHLFDGKEGMAFTKFFKAITFNNNVVAALMLILFPLAESIIYGIRARRSLNKGRKIALFVFMGFKIELLLIMFVVAFAMFAMATF